MSEKALLEVKDLSVEYHTDEMTVKAVNGVSYSLDAGKVLGVVGESGSGKSVSAMSILRLLDGNGYIDSGEILFNGQDITHLGITERAKLGISYGFQQPPRFKGIRVSDLLNVAAGKNLGHDEACSYLTKVGLCARDYLNRDVDTSLSGGEVKRIEIATLLAKNSRLMIFDEPEAGIDLWSFARLTETFRELHEKGGRTILIISHQERIIRLADEIILIANGEIAGRGTADELYPKLLSQTVAGCNLLEVNGIC